MPTSLPFDGPRRLKPHEQDAARRLSEICFEEVEGEAPLLPPEPAGAQQPPRRRPNDTGETYVIAAEGRLVSLISIGYTPLNIAGARLRVGHIGGVCTHPDYRQHRFAGRLMARCAARLAELGAHFHTISGERGLYRRAGNVPMGRFRDFTLRPGADLPPAGGARVRRAQPADAPFAARLYQNETAHFTRQLDAFTRRFEPHKNGFRAEEYVVELDGAPAAYLLLSIPYDYLDQPEPKIRRVVEYAGSRLALAAAGRLLLAELGLEALLFPVPWQDTDLIRLLLPAQPGAGYAHQAEHTLRILNFPALMLALRPYLQAVLSPAQRRGLTASQAGPLLAIDENGAAVAEGGGGTCILARGADRLELDTGGMSSLVFGDPTAAQPAAPGALDAIVKAAFPLPAFNMGIDYH